MFFKSITIAGFGSFPEVPTTFTFDNRFTTIVGKNGSGKTSVLHAIMWVLFGKESSRVAGDMGSVVNKACYQSDVTLELVDNEGDEVTIHRVYSDTDRGGNHTLTVKRGRFKKTSITAAQKEIWRILDVDPSVFLALSVIDQHGTGKIDSIMKASPAERRAVISALLPNGEEWAKVHKRAVAARREAKRTLKEKESELRHVEAEFAALPHLGDTLDCPFSDEDLRAARAKAQKLELEDNDKKRVEHLRLWYFIKGKDDNPQEGLKYLKELRNWWRKGGRSLKPLPDAITGATQKPGKHNIEIKSDDPRLAKLKDGSYTLMIEAVREEGGIEAVSIPFSLPVKEKTEAKASGKSELGDITLTITP